MSQYKKVASMNGIHGTVYSPNVVSGAGGGHGIVFSTLKEFLRYAPDGTGGLGDVSSNNPD